MRVIEEINRVFHSMMEASGEMYFIGEDILDPYGGAFKASVGLSSKFPDRVWTTPISEAGIVAVATGMAMHGKRPVVEIMFGDFLSLTFDQLLNHASKLQWMYNDQLTVPLIVRTPMGGGRGYGPTHSQSIEKHFCGASGLNVFALNRFSSIEEIYSTAWNLESPCLVIENKTMYGMPYEPNGLDSFEGPADICIVSYGSGLELAKNAAIKLEAEEEITTKIIPISQLSPFPDRELRSHVGDSEIVIAVEEGQPGWGFASECAHALINSKVYFDAVSARPHPIPSSRNWEANTLPNANMVVDVCMNAFVRRQK